MAIVSVPVEKSYRLLNIGATTLVSAKAEDIENVMSVAWSCALDYGPLSKVTTVLDKQAFTRGLVEKSGLFAIQIPVANQAELVIKLGTTSRHNNPHKIDDVEIFYPDGFDVPLVKGCAGWIICQLIRDENNQQNHDLFIGKVLAAYADDRVFKDAHWIFEQAPNELRTLHYVAGGQFYLIGESLEVK
ncbi:flavin reductase family protein [Basfia succiniciproducens]|uniref:NADH-FMN oxidoreductase RutF, flavin reductase (DIM6/NTAB) family n=1 Tax=Basfia succiniciproducens TaxID=653940 RepID=A0A1G5AV52_9PAST|nr:flavin reductase [Basfia succiniciproducens]QIM69687.1 flavin reductase [Basfia succiniciproducens]SCX81782.1 NADH-FMN oxidoreductase RutF, flavin reductase (DIM6/NTAB) family [Basfia succiniciproducens]